MTTMLTPRTLRFAATQTAVTASLYRWHRDQTPANLLAFHAARAADALAWDALAGPEMAAIARASGGEPDADPDGADWDAELEARGLSAESPTAALVGFDLGPYDGADVPF